MREHIGELVREFVSGGVGGFIGYWLHHTHHRLYRLILRRK